MQMTFLLKQKAVVKSSSLLDFIWYSLHYFYTNINNNNLCMTASRACARNHKVWAKRKNDCDYKPRDFETNKRFSTESTIYPSFELSVFHLPCLLRHLLSTSEFAAIVAPPDLKE